MFPGSLTMTGGHASQGVPMGGQGGGFTTIYPVTESMETGEGGSRGPLNIACHI
jgi:hypothetical protein